MTALLDPVLAECGPVLPSRLWAHAVASGRISEDPGHAAVLPALDRLHAALQRPRRRARWLPKLRLRRLTPVRGLYLWGGVGRGKTLLLDLLFLSLAELPRERVHFHRFMGQVHAELAGLRGRRDPLKTVAERIARRCRLLCLDEFFVVDIGDAMILAGLLTALFERGLTLVTTSNTPPAELYRDGLQRARFVPAIGLIERHCEVLSIGPGSDYRLRALSQAPVYHQPAGPASEAALAACFARLAGGDGEGPVTLEVNERPLRCRRVFEGVVWFDFAELCEGPRAVADYIELARSFHTLLLSDVPCFDAERNDAARRFVHLVDALYEHNVNLVVSACAAPSGLYVDGRLRAEFERTASRLVEMQSEAYLSREHLA